jgi:hypothetical protein
MAGVEPHRELGLVRSLFLLPLRFLYGVPDLTDEGRKKTLRSQPATTCAQ